MNSMESMINSHNHMNMGCGSQEDYRIPPLSLLNHCDDDMQVDETEQNANKESIIGALKCFGVEVRTISTTIGAAITLYEIIPAGNVLVSKIPREELETEIALRLSLSSVRVIIPLPGKKAIGIELPNKKRCIVSMQSVLNSSTYRESGIELPCALGKTITDEVFVVDLAKSSHILVGGATGQGKSVCLHTIVASLLYRKCPTELKFVMIDPRHAEFDIYAPIAIPFLANIDGGENAIITDSSRAAKILNALCKLMKDRFSLLRKAHVANIIEYNEKIRTVAHNAQFMPFYVVLIDELGELIITAGKKIQQSILRLAQLSHVVGIHMVIATQLLNANIISGTLKANFPTRIAFRTATLIDSYTILNGYGANQLTGCSDMLYKRLNNTVRVQGAFVDRLELNRICEYISRQQHR